VIFNAEMNSSVPFSDFDGQKFGGWMLGVECWRLDAMVRPVKWCVLFLMILCCAAPAQKPAAAPPPPPPPGSAFEAMSLLPRESAKNLARIEAREGRLKPERWYLLVHDPEAPRGLREFVVAGGKIAAARSLSQFADRLTEDQIFGDAFVRADSEYCVRVAELFAAANGSRPGYIDYELYRPNLPPPPPPPDPAVIAMTHTHPSLPSTSHLNPEITWPIWRLTVLDAKGDQLGTLTISAARGTVITHDGFERVPDPGQMPIPPTPPPASVTNPKPPAKDAKAKTEPTPKPKKKRE
jgi:hypothetical protein